jgi:hypothetical protein
MSSYHPIYFDFQFSTVHTLFFMCLPVSISGT